MNAIYVLLIVLQVGVLVYFLTRGKKSPLPATLPPVPDSYEGLRSLAASITPQQLKLAIPDNQLLVYGVIMDWHMGEAIVTLAAYITGAANMYFSTGEGITGGGKNPLVGEAAVEFVIAAKDYFERLVKVNTLDLPLRGCVRFHFLTNHGIYAAQEQIIHIQDATSPYIILFELGNRVLTEMQGGGNGQYVDITLN